jgi:16S rRNA (adenine1518-N6/adenine1519-N6)-dimethyltransferase
VGAVGVPDWSCRLGYARRGRGRRKVRGLDFIVPKNIVTAVISAKARARKALGQHFLVDNSILDRIAAAAELTPEDVVVEVGPGLGALTRRLVQQAGRVAAVEMDADLAVSLPARLGNPSNLTVVEADARTVDIVSLVGKDIPYKVVANLPYYAANPIIRRFLESEPRPWLMVVMVQREVAQSMTASPGEMGILSVAVQYYAIPSLVCDVPPRAFRPSPKVTSSVLKLRLRERPSVEVADPEAFFTTVQAGFSAPRKQLRNSLSQGLGVSGEEAGRLLILAEVDWKRRAETLSLEEWARIYHVWEKGSSVGSPGLRQN